MKCGYEKCGIDLQELITVIDDGEDRFALCPNHQIGYALDGMSKKKIETEPSQVKGQDIRCELCGKGAYVFLDPDMKTSLCPEHIKALLFRNLQPHDWKKLHDKYGEIYLLHNDFYDEVGYALQPVR